MSGMEKWKHLRIPFADIKNGTKNFIKEIGRGGYGSVYEGKLFVNGESLKVAVKRSSEKHGQGLKEYLTELDLLWNQEHKNIITLVGFCDEINEKIIVYEYAERGSLDYYFRFRNTSYTLTWIQRLKIVVDVARGLDHLHNHLPKKQVIIHRDIKSSNILIDQEWVAKISDFGLSKSTSTGLDRSTVVTWACGTPGYVEPELKKFFLANKKADVYSFGMVLCEVLCGTLCKSKVEEDKVLSAEVFEEYYTKDKLDKIIDPCLKEQLNPNVLSKFSAIAYKCLQAREQRPPIDTVKKELEDILKIQVFHSTPAHSMSGIKGCRKMPFAEIKDATKDFTNVIGKGGFGYVYKGELSVHGMYMKVAVKRSKEEFGQGIKEFLTEIQLLSDIHHENIITLLGYCDEGKEKIIVYEYAEYGSLDMHIRKLTWLERLKIVVDIARGLDHLHNHLQNNQVILHRDIKSSNILLDKNLVAKICDFGLSKLTFSGLGRSMVTSQACGTMSYIEPEYVNTSLVTKKSDVYSFGMMLSEVLTGRLCTIRDNDGIRLSGNVAKEYYVNDKLDMIIDPGLRKQMSQESFKKYSTIVNNCLQDREQRPLMDIVKRELEETLKIEVLRWRNFISKHWFILDVENLSSKTDIEMPAEETEGLKNLSASCEENITKDEYGEKELANRYGYYIQRSDKPLHYTNKNELYLRLCEGFLCDNGKLWFSLCKLSDRICSMLPPTEILRDDIEYERLDTLSLCESRFPEVKVLGCAASYSLTCTLGSQMFSPQNMYACYLVFKYEENNKQPDDNHHLFEAEYGTLEGALQGKVLVRMYARLWDMKEDALEYAVESWMKERNDGWMEVMLSKPFNVFENHSMLKVRLSKLKGSFKGIIVEGVEFRPYI